MSDAGHKRAAVRRQRSIYQVHYSIERREEMTARPLAAPSALEVHKYGRQVAGHSHKEDTKFLGLLQCNNGTILKPMAKAAARREAAFYARVAGAAGELAALRRCVPAYHGCTSYSYAGHTQDYLVLEDLAARMLEPCIMDVKIGKRTWDPEATEEKIKSEQRKYAQCKQQYGFCIPGFQVYRLGSGQLCKYNKDYGKKLHSQAVIDALRTYLNGSGRLCRALLLQLLSDLWRIQKWCRTQDTVRLYAASLLLLYDAAKLRECCEPTPCSPAVASPPRGPRRRSHSLPGGERSFSGQLSPAGPVYKKLSSIPLAPLHLAQTSFVPPTPPTLPRLDHNHSPHHNYEEELSKIKMKYRAMLEQLSSDCPHPHPHPRPWATVKVIDFAHAYFNEEDERRVDDNFREGVDNFVEIFEGFLRETDDQVI